MDENRDIEMEDTELKQENGFEITDWHKLYGEGWTGEIIPQAMSHPAKFSRALIRHIYRHALGEGWIKEGDTVLDPFGGVGLGALDAMFFGINWIGIELEPRFVDLGGEARLCPGFSKEDWKRYHNRAGRLNYKTVGQDMFAWCPDCLQALTQEPKKEYAKARMISQEIPWADYHMWFGNIGMWNERYGRKLLRWGRGILLQGDSRKLLDVIRNKVSMSVSSPPYADISQSGGTKGLIEHGTGLTRGERSFTEYGDSPNNLGRLKATDELFDASVASPPFLAQSGGTNVTSKEGPLSDGRLLKRHSAGNAATEAYGDDPANLGNMPHGDVDLVTSSPPFKGQSADGGWQMLGKYAEQGKLTIKQVEGDPNKSYPSWSKDRDTSYGHTEGQLADMPDGDVDLVTSSPPYAETRIDGNGDEGSSGLRNEDGSYLRGSEGWEKRKEMGARYGNSEGNLGNLKADGSISSPPFEDSIANDSRVGKAVAYTGHKAIEYAPTDGNLGGGEDFWSAARLIVEQTYAALKPGGHAIWVVKDFVKAGTVVSFSDQWRRLCEAVGFKTIHWHRAMLVEEKGTQLDLFGGSVTKTIQRKSFFRRLAESKGSPRIDWENVLCMIKPERDGRNEIS